MEPPVIRYTVLLGQNENGSWTACVPALNWLADDGITVEEALANVRNAIIGYIHMLEQEGLPIPTGDPPGPLIAPWEESDSVTVGPTMRVSQSFRLELIAA